MAEVMADEASFMVTMSKEKRDFTLDLELIASLSHELNASFCSCFGDYSQVDWDDAPGWQKISCMDGVLSIINGSVTTPSQSHENWLALKTKEGWKYGPQKDPEKKEHPCMLPHANLPLFQQVKDELFFGIVNSLKKLYNGK